MITERSSGGQWAVVTVALLAGIDLSSAQGGSALGVSLLVLSAVMITRLLDLLLCPEMA